MPLLFKIMKTIDERHFINCPAPICNCDPNLDYKNEVVWCAGEDICKHKPYQKFQEQQVKLNKLFRKGKIEDSSFSAKQLEGLKIPKTRKKRVK
jgi:hypothetical protein